MTQVSVSVPKLAISTNTRSGTALLKGRRLEPLVTQLGGPPLEAGESMLAIILTCTTPTGSLIISIPESCQPVSTEEYTRSPD